MQEYNQNTAASDEKNYFVSEFLRYFSFWPWILISVVFFCIAGFIYLRYANFQYVSTAKIEILDKSQDREMALPTSMTVFNRSMINLENEMGVLNSFALHSRVVDALDFNIQYFTIGKVKTAQNHIDDWFIDYNLTFKDDLANLAGASFIITTNDDSGFQIESFRNDNFIKNYEFKSNSTFKVNHDLPFDFEMNLYEKDVVKKLSISTNVAVAKSFQNKITVDSDQKEVIN